MPYVESVESKEQESTGVAMWRKKSSGWSLVANSAAQSAALWFAFCLGSTLTGCHAAPVSPKAGTNQPEHTNAATSTSPAGTTLRSSLVAEEPAIPTPLVPQTAATEQSTLQDSYIAGYSDGFHASSGDGSPQYPCKRAETADNDGCTALLARLSKRCGENHIDDHGGGGFELDDVARCWPDTNGAWTVVPRMPLRITTNQELSGVYEVLRLDPRGKILGRSRPLRFAASTTTGITIAVHSADFDEDSTPELLTLEHQTDHSGSIGHVEGSMWRFAKGKVSQVDTPNRIVGVSDVDSDGRLDLLTDGPFYAQYTTNECGSVTIDTTTNGEFLVMHALPGGAFSATDAIARQFAATQCSVPPVESDFRGEQNCLSCDALPALVRCARLWGRDSDSLRRLLDTAYAECRNVSWEPLDGLSFSQSQAFEWAKTTPPFVLSADDLPKRK